MDRHALQLELERIAPVVGAKLAGVTGVMERTLLLLEHLDGLREILGRQPEVTGEEALPLQGVDYATTLEDALLPALPERAAKFGVPAALDWLERVLNKPTIEGAYCAELFGVALPGGPLAFGAAVLKPWAELSDHPSLVDLMARTSPAVSFGAVVTGPPLRLEVPVSVTRTRDDRKRSREQTEQANLAELAMSNVVNGLTAAGAGTPLIGRRWTSVTDPDFADLALPAGVSMRAPLGFITPEAVAITAEHERLVTKFLSLQGKFAKRVNVAASRLNKARSRWWDVEDRAIDAAICLEALLGDSRFDLTYKLQLRVAILLGDTLEKRLELSRLTKEFYNVRSAIVHGSPGATDAEVVRKGVDLAGRVLKEFVERGPFDVADLELAAGARADDNAAPDVDS